MRKLALGLIIALGIGAAAPSAAGPSASNAAPVRQVFLIQNSGWMEPFYADPSSPLKPFVESLIGKANLAGVPVTIASFNQDGQVAGRRSPDVVYEGPYDAGRIAVAVDGIGLPRKASGAYADADFRGALAGTFSRVMGGSEGVIWIVTNNKDAPDNRPGVVENTRAFYDALRKSPYVTALDAFPMRKLVSGPHYSERGLIFYAIAYGDRGRRALATILRDGAPARSLFPFPPVRLKPLTTDPVELRLSSPAAGVDARVVAGRLVVSGVAGGRRSTLPLRGDLRNTYYPQNIAKATMDARWISSDPALAGTGVRIDPGILRDVPAGGESGPVRLVLDLPAVPRERGLAGIFEDRRTAVGEVELSLRDMSFSLDPGFVGRISAVSGGDGIRADEAEAVVAARLPEVFLDYRRVSSSSMRVPVQLTFSYSPWPLVALIAAAIAIIAAVASLAIVMLRGREHRIRVGTEERLVRLRPGERRILSDSYGDRVEARGRIVGDPFVKTLEPQ